MAGTILCYGDSNTHGTCPMQDVDDIRRFGRQQRWPGVLQIKLGPDWNVIEEGHPGRTTVHPDPVEGVHKNGRAILLAVLESHRPIDHVILMLGTNDFKARFSVSAMEIASSIYLLLHDIKHSLSGPDRAAPDILLVCPPPIRETGFLAEMFAGAAEKSRQLPQHLLAVAQSAEVAFLDSGQLIESDGQDGIHLDAKSHARLAGAIAVSLENRQA